jgi:peptidoglycan L-alanyl-D-glutamate endopeptidase CwlK
MGSQLVENPELANDPKIAALVLAAYIARHRGQIQSALSHGNLRSARRAVNGGTNGLDVFEKAYTIGLNLTRKELRDLPNVSSIA